MLPEDQLFADEETPATAAVHAQRRRPTRSTRAPCAASPRSSPRSVKGLKSDNVTITDGSGRSCGRRATAPAAAAGRGKQAAEARYARDLEADAERAAHADARPGQGAGAGQRRPQRRPDHAREARRTTRRARRSRRRPRPRSSRAAAAPPAAPPAPAANIPQLRGGRGGGRRRTRTTSTRRSTTEFGVGKTVTQTEVAPGRRQQARRRARGRQVGPAPPTSPRSRTPWPAPPGIDTERGDTIAVRAGRRSPSRRRPKAGPVPDRAARPAQVGRLGLAIAALPLLRDAATCAARGRGAREPAGCAEIEEPAPLAELEAPTAASADPSTDACPRRAETRTSQALDELVEREPERVAAPGPRLDERGLMSEPSSLDPSRPARPRARPGAALGRRQKAAVLLVALGAEHAAEIFKHLHEDEIEALSLEMAQSRQVARRASPRPSSTRSSRRVLAAGLRRPRAASTTRARCSSSSLGAERARRDHRPPRRRRSRRGRSSSCAARRRSRSHVFLRNESPQTIALVIANLHTTLAAQVLAAARPRTQADVALRIAHDGRDLARGHQREVEAVMRDEALERDRAGVLRRRRRRVARRHPQPRRPLHRAQRARRARREHRAELAEEVRALLFVFEDIVSSTTARSSWCCKEVDQKDLALALRGVTEEVRGQDLREHVRSAAPRCCARRSSSCRRSASASSRRRRAGSSPSCAGSRRPARS